MSFENRNSHIDLWAQSLFFLKSNITLKLKVHSCTVQIYVWECWSIHVLNRSSIRAMCVYYSYFIAHVQIWKGRNKCRWLRLKYIKEYSPLPSDTPHPATLYSNKHFLLNVFKSKHVYVLSILIIWRLRQCKHSPNLMLHW